MNLLQRVVFIAENSRYMTKNEKKKFLMLYSPSIPSRIFGMKLSEAIKRGLEGKNDYRGS